MKLNPIILSSLISLLSPVLQNPVPCGADGLLGDAHDAARGLIVHAHFVEDEEEGIVGDLELVFMGMSDNVYPFSPCTQSNFFTHRHTVTCGISVRFSICVLVRPILRR